MGSCASIYRKSDSSRKNLASLVHLETDRNPDSIPCTPVKNINKPDVLVRDLPIGTTFSNYGSKEESFFDSQAWLESDCDDDFYSVRGDFTPSRGNTPIHSSRNLSPSRALVVEGENRSFHGGNEVQADEEKKKKKSKLGDLFHESARSDKDEFKTDTAPPSKRTHPCCFPSPRGFKKSLFSPPPVTVDA